MSDYLKDCDIIEKALNELLDTVIDEHRTSDYHEAEIRAEYDDAFKALERIEAGIRRFRRGR